MKGLKHERMVDIFTGIVLGGLIGLYHPLAQYQLVLVVLSIVLGLRYFKVIT